MVRGVCRLERLGQICKGRIKSVFSVRVDRADAEAYQIRRNSRGSHSHCSSVKLPDNSLQRSLKTKTNIVQPDVDAKSKAPAIPSEKEWKDRVHPALKSPPAIPNNIENVVKRELRWLKDPRKLDGRVRHLLQAGDVPLALTLLRTSSRRMNVVRSWNTVVDYFATRGEILNAVRAYNEMKKRAQFPDAVTYTLLLRGLAANADKDESLPKALSIYRSLHAPNAKAEPSIIHTNAVLKVCAEAGNLDALWDVVGTMPETGPTAPDHVTYAIILEALWLAVRKDKASTADAASSTGEDYEHRAQTRETTVDRGRQLWTIVVDRWLKTKLDMQPNLVRAMGHLLLASNHPSDWDDVLSLIEQATLVPRQLSRLPRVLATSTEGYSATHHLGARATDLEKSPFKEVHNQTQSIDSANIHIIRDDGFHGRSPTIRGPDDHCSYPFSHLETLQFRDFTSRPIEDMVVIPNNHLLTLVLTACTLLGQRLPNIGAASAASRYWTLMTKDTRFGFEPDEVSFHAYLRALRQSRNSREALKTVQQMEHAGLTLKPKTFRIAMSTCFRNMQSPTALKEGARLLELMAKQPYDSVNRKTVDQFECMLRSGKGERHKSNSQALRLVNGAKNHFIPGIATKQWKKPLKAPKESMNDRAVKIGSGGTTTSLLRKHPR